MVTGEDRQLKCVECGEEFLFTAGEQTFYREKGLTHAPTRCKRCREARKGGSARGEARSAAAAPSGAARSMYTAVCSECGDQTQVPFQPTSGRPVFCRTCFQNRKPARAGAARGAPVPVAASGTRATGVVKWFNEGRGYGFILDDGGEELFVHFSAIRGEGFRTLAGGDRVEYDVTPGPRGRQAADVVRVA